MSSVAIDKVAPFWQYFVLVDMPLTLVLKEWVALCFCLIESSVDRCEHSSPPDLGDLREEPVFTDSAFIEVFFGLKIISASICG